MSLFTFSMWETWSVISRVYHNIWVDVPSEYGNRNRNYKLSLLMLSHRIYYRDSKYSHWNGSGEICTKQKKI